MVTAAALSSLIVLVTFVAQIWQLVHLPVRGVRRRLRLGDVLARLSAAFHLFTVLFLTTAVLGRTRKGLISPANPYHAHLVAMFMTWTVIAIFLGALFATTMTDSPNSNSPAFGGFSNAAATRAPLRQLRGGRLRSAAAPPLPRPRPARDRDRVGPRVGRPAVVGLLPLAVLLWGSGALLVSALPGLPATAVHHGRARTGARLRA